MNIMQELMCYAVQNKCLISISGCPSSADAGHHPSSALECSDDCNGVKQWQVPDHLGITQP